MNISNVYVVSGQYYGLDHAAQQVYLDTSNGGGTGYQSTGGDYMRFCKEIIAQALITYGTTLFTANPMLTMTDANSNADATLTNLIPSIESGLLNYTIGF